MQLEINSFPKKWTQNKNMKKSNFWYDNENPYYEQTSVVKNKNRQVLKKQNSTTKYNIILNLPKSKSTNVIPHELDQAENENTF